MGTVPRRQRTFYVILKCALQHCSGDFARLLMQFTFNVECDTCPRNLKKQTTDTGDYVPYSLRRMLWDL